MDFLSTAPRSSQGSSRPSSARGARRPTSAGARRPPSAGARRDPLSPRSAELELENMEDRLLGSNEGTPSRAGDLIRFIAEYDS